MQGAADKKMEPHLLHFSLIIFSLHFHVHRDNKDKGRQSAQPQAIKAELLSLRRHTTAIESGTSTTKFLSVCRSLATIVVYDAFLLQSTTLTFSASLDWIILYYLYL